MKSKLGISVGLVAAAVYFAGLVGGYTVLILMVGYVLLAEENPWLRKTAVKALVVCMLFSLLSVVFNFLPTGLDMLCSFLSVFQVYPNMNVVFSLCNLMQGLIEILRSLMLLILGFLAVNQATIPLGPIDNLIHKHM